MANKEKYDLGTGLAVGVLSSLVELPIFLGKVFLAATIVGCLGVGAGTYYMSKSLTPNSAQVVSDLNNDGIDDLVITNVNGHHTPLYGSKEGTFQRQYEIKYSTIEERINE